MDSKYSGFSHKFLNRIVNKLNSRYRHPFGLKEINTSHYRLGGLYDYKLYVQEVGGKWGEQLCLKLFKQFKDNFPDQNITIFEPVPVMDLIQNGKKTTINFLRGDFYTVTLSVRLKNFRTLVEATFEIQNLIDNFSDLIFWLINPVELQNNQRIEDELKQICFLPDDLMTSVKSILFQQTELLILFKTIGNKKLRVPKICFRD